MRRFIPAMTKCLLGLLVFPAFAMQAVQLPGRDVAVNDAPPARLRSMTAPVADVAIAPTARQLAEAAQTAAFGDNPVPPLAKVLGVKPPPRPAAPRRVGSVFAPATQAFVAQWEPQTNGSNISHVRVTSAGALGIRVRLQLPAGLTLGELRVVADAGAVAQRVPLFVAVDGEIWTPYTEGPTQIIEIETMQRVAGAQMQVLSIVHFEESLIQSGKPGAPAQTLAAGTCSPDVVCSAGDSGIDTAISQLKKSVARMNFISGGSSYLCTGTLINSTSQQNFLLTANHCISTQAEASSIQTRWFYESTTCGGGVAALNPGSDVVGGGAQLVFTNQFVDSTLLRLNLSPPGGARFAGWDSAEMSVNTTVVSLSHPTGDVMKYATGTMSVPGQTDGLLRLRGYEQEMYGILFSRGVIEGGSSGSGIFTLSAGQLVLRGVLSSSTLDSAGNSMSCAHPGQNANYGRFSYFYPQVAALLAGGSLPVDDHPNQPMPTATAIPLDGTPVRGTLGSIGDLDVFRINVAQAGTVYVKSSGGYDLIGNLMDANGATLETNDDASVSGFDFGISWQVSPGTYYLAVAPWTPTDLTLNGYSVSATFSTATTNYTSLWWGGDAESGWGVNVNHQGNVIFATMFNYENAGLGTQNPGMWLSSVGNRVGNANSFSGALLRVNGPGFNAAPFTPITAVNATQVGNMRFDFTGPNTGTLTFNVAGAGTGGSGGTITKNITRQTFATLPNCRFSGADRSYADNFQDLWWNPNESGWGINFTHQSDTIFATLFTYEPGPGAFNKGLWLTAVMPKQTGFGVYQGDLLRVTGSAFSAAPFIPLNPAVNASRVGSMRVEFSDGNAGTLTYDVNGQSVTKTIERQVFDFFKPLCEKPE
jgi:hypothetical protein